MTQDDPSNLEHADQNQDSDDQAEEVESGEAEVAGAGQDKDLPQQRPSTKNEMSKLRERFQNTMKLVAHLYHDVSLKDEFRMVACATRAYMIEYSETFEAQKTSQVGFKVWKSMFFFMFGSSQFQIIIIG